MLFVDVFNSVPAICQENLRGKLKFVAPEIGWCQPKLLITKDTLGEAQNVETQHSKYYCKSCKPYFE